MPISGSEVVAGRELDGARWRVAGGEAVQGAKVGARRLAGAPGCVVVNLFAALVGEVESEHRLGEDLRSPPRVTRSVQGSFRKSANSFWPKAARPVSSSVRPFKPANCGYRDSGSRGSRPGLLSYFLSVAVEPMSIIVCVCGLS